MKNIWKRTGAFVLTVCMLFSLLPPFVFAATEEPLSTPLEQIVYDFRLDTLGLKYTNTQNEECSFANNNIVERNSAGTALNATSVLRQEAIANYYASGTLNWKMHSATGSHFSIGSNTTQVNWRNDSAYVYNKKVGDAYTAGHYFAMTVRSPGTGNYDVTLNYGTSANGAAQGSVYLLSADADLTTALTPENALGTVDFEEGTNQIATAASKIFDKTVRMVADKEYLLVFKCDQVGAKVNAMYLSSVVLNLNVPASAITYDFRLDDNTDLTYTDTAGTPNSFSNANIIALNSAGTAFGATTQKMQEAIAGYYDNGMLNWKFQATNFTHASMVENHKSAYIYHKTFTTGNYFAVTVRSPGTGDYQMTVNHGQNKQGSTKGGVYLFDASVDPADWATATPLFKDYVDYSRNANTTAITSTVFDASIPMEADKTYTLVFTNEGAVNSAYGGSFNAMYLDSVVLEQNDPNQETTAPTETTEPTEATEVTEATEATEATEPDLPPLQVDEIKYDFALEDAGLTYNYKGEDRSFYNANFWENSNTGAAMRNAVSDYYGAGTLNWKYNAHTGSNFIVGKADGTWGSPVYMYYKNSNNAYTDGYYSAATVRSPGTGDYKMTLNYAVGTKGAAKGSVYLLPGDTADIAAALTSAAAVGSVSYEGTSAKPKAETATFDTVLPMEAGKEYILVFVCDQAGASLNGQYVKDVVLNKYVPGTPSDEPVQPPLQADEIKYDFALADAGLVYTYKDEDKSFYNTNSLENSNTGKAMRNAVSDYYDAGTLNWKYNAHTGSHFLSGKADGIWGSPAYIYYQNSNKEFPDAYYLAVTVRSPGTGDYKMTLNYGTAKRGAAKGSIYLLSGDTMDIAAAIASETAVGSVCYEGTSAKAKAETDTFDTVLSMEAGKEYILVFACEQTGASYNGQLVNNVVLKKYVPGAPSDEPSVPTLQVDEIIYDLGLADAGLTYNYNEEDRSFYNTNFLENSNMGRAMRNAVSDYYDAGTLHWKYTAHTGSHFIGGKADGTWGSPVYMYYKNSDGAYTDGYYFAITVRSPGTGDYKLTLNYATATRGAAKGSIYLLPGNTVDIAAAIASTEAVGSVCYEGKTAKAAPISERFNDPVSLQAGQEYILVFVCDQAGASLNGQYVSSVKLTKAKPPIQVDKIVYDFDLGGNGYTYDNGKSPIATNLLNASLSKLRAAVVDYYNAETIHWKYHSRTAMSHPYVMFGGDSKYDFDGISMSGKNDGVTVENFYYAMTIRSPGTGEYKLTLDYGAHINGAKRGSIYILPAKTEDVASAIAAGKAIGTVNYDNGFVGVATAAPGRSTFNKAIPMEAGKEYLLVFTSDVMGRSNAFLYVDTVTLTKVGLATPADIIPERKPEPKPIPAGSTVYDTDLCDSLNGIYKSKTFVNDAIEDINSRYNSGISNWGWAGQEMLNNGGAFIATGMALYATEMEWIALKIKSPGKGLYTVGMNHAITTDGAIGAMYILPADTEDIGAALDIDNRVGKVSFTNMTGVAGIEDYHQTLAGTWEFGEDEEYILVIEAYKTSYFHDTRAYMYVSQIFMTPGDIMPEETEQQKVISPVVVDPGPIKVLEGTYYGTTSKVNGNNYMFMPVEGNKMLVFDLDNDLIVDEVDIPATRSYAIELDADGNVWLGGEGKSIFRYDPYTQVGEVVLKIDTINPNAKSVFYMKHVDGYMYFGIYGPGTIGRYNIATGQTEEFGPFHEDTVYLNAIEYKDGYLYAGLCGDKNNDGKKLSRVVKLDAETGEQVDYIDVDHLMGEEHTLFTGIGFAGDLLLLGSSYAGPTIVAIDPETMEYVDLGVRSSIMWEITEEVDGKVYFLLDGMGLHSMDVQTREIKLVPGFNDVNRPVRCGERSIIEVDDPVYPGISIATYSASTGDPWLYNLQTGKTKSYYELLDDSIGLGTTMRSLITGEPGSNLIYMGAFNTPDCVFYNTETGEFGEFTAVSAQTDSMVLYKGVLYTGNYTTGCITRINIEDESRNQVLLTLHDEVYNQARIHTLAAGDDKIFAGSTPHINDYGGCLAWVDLNTMERHVVRNVVQDQTVNCVIYHDGLVYGTTSIHGGSGSKLRDDLSAKLFIYDVDNKGKLAEFDLRDYISGMEGNIDYISGIAADPNVDENGRFWGLVSETLFSFSYDRDTGKLTVKEELSFRKNYYPTGGSRNWFPKPFRFDGKGNLYLAFEDTGGMRRINLENTADNERIMPMTPLHYTLGEDGNIYYALGAELQMYPLNVTEEDWAQADKVDQMILALKGEITLKSEEAIVAARAAYEALELRYKALIQHLDILEEAEVELLELQIENLPKTVTLEHKDLIQGLVAKYKAMTARQQLYVKNYDLLETAVDALNVLLDKQAAAEVQAMIDSIKDLGELTLEHKDIIAEIREAYNELSSYQKQYVDATALLEAEAIMAVLRAQAIEHLKELIASIGEVTLEDEPIIVEADSIFSWLTLEERQQVDGATLSSAKIQLTKLQKEAAAQVDALIGKIGNVGLFSGFAISKARKAYDALTEGSKAYVSLIDTLLAAEKAFKPIAVTLWCVGGVVVAGGGAATVIVLKKKRKAVPEKTTESTQ